ncbi:MAG: FmdB family transcriptional regulator [Actinobacteria bacterium]|nr:FmdB family transcriptional regulator [Actinomycetota bacterium]
MPTYEYACRACGESFEVFQSFADKPLRKHEDCGGDLQKVFHARGIVFKGPGFYATDKRPAPAKSSDSKSSDSKSSDSRRADSSQKSSKETAKASSSSSDD